MCPKIEFRLSEIIPKNWFISKLNKALASFFAKFLGIYVMIFLSSTAKNLAKNEEKPCSTCLNPFLQSPSTALPKQETEISGRSRNSYFTLEF